MDYVNLLQSRLTAEQAVFKLKLSKPRPTWIENYHYLQQIWKQEPLSSFKDYLRLYNIKIVVPTLEAMQKMIAFYHNKDVFIMKLGCTLRNLANNCLKKSADEKFYSFTEGDKESFEKIQEDVVGGPSIVFTRKAVADETFVWKSTNICKSIVGIDASQLYPYLMCQPMTTGLYTRRYLIVKLRVLHYRQTEENWLLQCWWVLFSLQYCVWSNGLLLPLLSLSRAPPISHWRRYQTWQ